MNYCWLIPESDIKLTVYQPERKSTFCSQNTEKATELPPDFYPSAFLGAAAVRLILSKLKE